MITLYEFPSCLPNRTPVSPFTNLVRCVLNYKQLDFHTEFVYVQDLEALAHRIGAEPTDTRPDGSPKYTVPIIADNASSAGPTVVSDSLDILIYLEKTYPDPEKPLFSISPSTSAIGVDVLASMSFTPVMIGLYMKLMATAVDRHIPPESRDYWVKGLAQMGITDLRVIQEGEPEFEEAVKTAHEGLGQTVVRLLKRQAEEQPGKLIWIGGERPVYPDFLLLGALRMVQLWRPEVFERLVEVGDGILKTYLKAGEGWFKLTLAMD